jgi:hypothetical protein
MRDGDDALNIAHIADAATQLLAAGVRQRVVIHCPEGAWGEAPGEQVAGSRHGCWSRKRLSAASARAMRFARGFYTAAMNRSRSRRVFIWRTPARASLLAANAIDGAKTLAELQAFIRESI